MEKYTQEYQEYLSKFKAAEEAFDKKPSRATAECLSRLRNQGWGEEKYIEAERNRRENDRREGDKAFWKEMMELVNDVDMELKNQGGMNTRGIINNQ